MPQSPNQAKSNGKDKNTIIKKMTIIQDARLNKSTNISDLNPPPLQTNSNSSNNDGWKQQTGKRNQSSSSEPNSPTNIQKTTKNKKIFTSRNRFEVLSQTESIEVDTTASNPTSETNDPESTPPPQQEKITHLRAELIDLVGPENFTFKSSINNLNIQMKNPETYRAIIHFLQEVEADFHTFQMQEHKAYRIVIRNLHPTTNTAEIRTALEEIGYQVRQITNVLHKHTKINLPISHVRNMVIQKLIVHIRQDAFDVPNITPPQLAKSLATFLPNMFFAKVNTLPTVERGL